MTESHAPAATAPARTEVGPAPLWFAPRTFPAGSVPRYVPVQRRCNSVATAGFVLGVLGVVLCWVPIVNVLCGLLGVVFGARGVACSARAGTGRPRAVAGLVLGVVSLIPATIIFVAVLMA